MNTANISPVIREKAPQILAEIQKSGNVLLHCHPSPDPDSVGSALAMKFALEGMGKRVTLIRGDSEIPEAFMHFPGVDSIAKKNFFEIDLGGFDLFIILDSGSKEMISRFKPVTLPFPIRSIVIDHHSSNIGFGDLNLIEPAYPAVSQILFDLFTLWNVVITPDIAGDLFIAIYTDTGGFKYEGTTQRTFNVAAELVAIIPRFPKIISEMENSRTPTELAFQALALDSIQVFGGGALAMSIVSLEALKRKNIPLADVRGNMISPILRSVADWHITGILVELEPNNIKMSFRSKDSVKYDVSKLAVALGGGGHKAASGATLLMSMEEAMDLVVSKVKELYNL